MRSVIPVLTVLPILTRRTFETQRFGIFMAALGGIGIAGFIMALNKAFAENKVGIVTPIVFGGAIFLSTILSIFIFKEKLTALESVGLGVLGLGLAIVIYARATH